MHTTSTTVYLKPDARLLPRLDATNHLALVIRPDLYDMGSDVTLATPHSNGHVANADFWQALADQAHTIAVRCDELAAAEVAQGVTA